jgi:hypothetical protein
MRTKSAARASLLFGLVAMAVTAFITTSAFADASGDDAGGIVRAFEPDDLAAIAHLDRAATGEDRRHLLATFAGPDTTKVVAREGDPPTGFTVSAV